MKNKKQIGCKHEKAWCYTYELKDDIFDLCDGCEKKLRKQILEQIKNENNN